MYGEEFNNMPNTFCSKNSLIKIVSNNKYINIKFRFDSFIYFLARVYTIFGNTHTHTLIYSIMDILTK